MNLSIDLRSRSTALTSLDIRSLDCNGSKGLLEPNSVRTKHNGMGTKHSSLVFNGLELELQLEMTTGLNICRLIA